MTIASIRAWADRQVTAVRRRVPMLDHGVRALQHTNARSGFQLAAGITYYAFLSFFPLVALAYAVVGFVVDYVPGARQAVTDVLVQLLPNMVGEGPGQLDVGQMAAAKAGVGVVGLLGLLYAGLGWISSLRTSLEAVFTEPASSEPGSGEPGSGEPGSGEPGSGEPGTSERGEPGSREHSQRDPGSESGARGANEAGGAATSDLAESQRRGFVAARIADVRGLFLIGIGLLVGIGFGGVLSSGAGQLAVMIGFPGARLLVVLVAELLVVGTMTVVVFATFRLLPARAPGPRGLVTGSLLVAIGFEVLRQLATLIVGQSTANPLYGAFAVVVALLVWTNYTARLVILGAAWAVTAADGREGRTAPGATPAR